MAILASEPTAVKPESRCLLPASRLPDVVNHTAERVTLSSDAWILIMTLKLKTCPSTGREDRSLWPDTKPDLV